MNMDIFWGLFIPFLGTSLGACSGDLPDLPPASWWRRLSGAFSFRHWKNHRHWENWLLFPRSSVSALAWLSYFFWTM